MAKKEVKALDLLKELKTIYTNGTRDKLAPVYIIYGEEFYIRERALYRLKQIMKKLNGSIERATFDSKTDIADFINNLNEASMFNPLKLVIASEFSDLKGEQIEKLIEYLKNPSPDVILLLLSYKIDKRKKNITDIFNYGIVCNGRHPSKDELQTWIRGFATERGKTIDAQSVDFLGIKYEGELSRIEKEVEKTALYLGEKTTITRRDIEFTATGVSSCSIFDISPVLATKDRKQVLQRIQKLLNTGENPVSINSTIMNRIKRLLLAHDILLSKAGDSELAKAIGIPPFFIPDFKRELRNYKREDLVKMYKRCMNTDSELKSARRDKDDVLVSGILDLLARRV
ncbi:MAG: DNA polymerase III subunit delta [Proteobacteria bacterium]|nr:DNA polymerase III subunit delta [Pseudomonadota bacterium]